MPAFFPVLLTIHILLAVSLFLPSLLLPFLLRRRAELAEPGRLARALLWLQSGGTAAIAAGVALSGLGLVAVLGVGLLTQPWLLAALLIYAADLAVAFFIQRPNLRRLLSRAQSQGAGLDDEVWRTRARRQRYVSYGMAGAVGAIGFLMSTKPALW
jgi:hypothetical protein